MRTFLMSAIAGTAFAVALILGVPANAAAISFKADLTGAQETPPTDSKGKGAADVAYDAATKTLTEKYNKAIEQTWSGQIGKYQVQTKVVPAKPGQAGNIFHVIPGNLPDGRCRGNIPREGGEG